MKPLSYDSFPNPNAPIYITLLVLVGAVAVATILIAFYINKRRPSDSDSMTTLDSILLVVSTISCLGLTMAGMGTQISGERESRDMRIAKIQSELQDRYSFEPTEAEVDSLDYPEEAPGKDFEVYGSFEQRIQTDGANFTEQTVYLVWADGELQLSQSEDGKSFKELKVDR